MPELTKKYIDKRFNELTEFLSEKFGVLATKQDLLDFKGQLDRTHQLVAGLPDQINDINSRLLKIEDLLDDPDYQFLVQ